MRDTGKEEVASAGPRGEVDIESANRMQAADKASTRSEGHASQYCPVCSQKLESRRCKLVCNVCGYYMSCADYY
ncbi:MAG: hypothetical protein WCE52_09520 [Candidatus Acidiferrum sp.]